MNDDVLWSVYRAIVGAGVGQFKSKTLGIYPNYFTRFRNAADR